MTAAENTTSTSGQSIDPPRLMRLQTRPTVPASTVPHNSPLARMRRGSGREGVMSSAAISD